MKTKFFMVMMSAMALAAFTANEYSKEHQSGEDLNWFQSKARDALDQACHQKIVSRPEWNLAGLLLNGEQKKQLIDEACSCITTQTVQRMSFSDLPKLLTENQRQEWVMDMLAETAPSCLAKSVEEKGGAKKVLDWLKSVGQ